MRGRWGGGGLKGGKSGGGSRKGNETQELGRAGLEGELGLVVKDGVQEGRLEEEKKRRGGWS